MMRAPNLPDVPVVIADADEYSRRLMREMLRAARIRRIQEVTSGEALVGRLAGSGHGVAFVDVELPRLDVPGVVSLLASPGFCCVGLSRRVTPELALSASPVFAGGLLLKPFTPSALWMRLITVLDLRGAGTASWRPGAGEAGTAGARHGGSPRPVGPPLTAGGTPVPAALREAGRSRS